MSVKQLSKKTVLYSTHLSLNARMDTVGGFIMPIQYSGIIKEHNATRQSVSIFDTCHLGKIRISGENACTDLEHILTCSVDSLAVGQCRYGFMCNEQGGMIDDLIIYRIAENKFILVVNSSEQHTDFEWVRKHSSENTAITDISDITAKIDLQGPKSPPVLNKLLDESITDLPYFHFTYRYYRNTKLLISRTGFTGELGFEIFCPHDIARSLWKACVNSGVTPAGLECRNTLRLEMGYPLYGHEIDDTHNPVETGYSCAIARDKTFIGSDHIPDEIVVPTKLVGITLSGIQTARHGDGILSEDKKNIGTVTSGSYSPSLEKAIALGYVRKEFSRPGTEIIISAHKKKMKASVSELPFYKEASGRKKLSDFL